MPTDREVVERLATAAGLEVQSALPRPGSAPWLCTGHWRENEATIHKGMPDLREGFWMAAYKVHKGEHE